MLTLCKSKLFDEATYPVGPCSGRDITQAAISHEVHVFLHCQRVDEQDVLPDEAKVQSSLDPTVVH